MQISLTGLPILLQSMESILVQEKNMSKSVVCCNRQFILNQCIARLSGYENMKLIAKEWIRLIHADENFKDSPEYKNTIFVANRIFEVIKELISVAKASQARLGQ